ncbi:toxin-antitoxin system HicB family antitoxin [Streptomyces cremeus]|uniref:Toxin-antitoxin system HicB family antitoxin n=1 Tax=Streptomyces cremeus TaxID=66881 RepID=A0ABV5P7L5_STRCM
MDLTPYVDILRRELAAAVRVGGVEARELAERLTAPLDAAARLTLLHVLSAAANEITRELAPGSVDVRMRGLDPDFVVTLPPADSGAPVRPAPPQSGGPGDDAGTARVNLRLSPRLKARTEEAAVREGLSLNAWLVRAAATALDTRTPSRTTEGTPAGDSGFTGWAR